MEVIVIHSTRFGSTEKYAFEIAKQVQCSAVKSQNVTAEDLDHYDIIVFGSCLLEGQLTDADKFQSWVEQYPNKKWALYTVGLSNPSLTNFTTLLSEQFSQVVLERVHFFHYRGSIQYKRLELMQDLIHRMKEKRVESLDQTPLSDSNRELLQKYGTYFDMTDIGSIKDLVRWIKSQ